MDKNAQNLTLNRIKGRDTSSITLAITAIVLVIGSIAFFATGAYKNTMTQDTKIYDGLRMKAAYTPEGSIKLFALPKTGEARKLSTTEGAPVPSDDKIVIGSAEAQMMIEEKLFTSVGDRIEGFFGINIVVGGILSPTNGSIDMMHLINKEQYAAIEGEENRVFIKKTAEGMPKLFYYKAIGEETSLNITLAEGDITQYTTTTLNGKTYQPVIIGSSEASMMREEKLFTTVGDRIDGFFGNDIIIIGIIKETGTPLDMMHIIPLTEKEIE